ncbi:hypothetical protein NEDG_01279 [Nematocida displodere]|uniref:Uncharacterized protein n=1 Tax=Nematocida displodere TaxID=1805483 RepID=A0A177EBV0_9MICR|nr:hypothetical protein NEDG_01279 [Nematocida displodere]
MNGSFEDELEFFSFLPSEFHLEVYTMITREMEASLGEEKPNTREKIDLIEAAIERNMLIFERFILRNILTFPESYVYERRLTAETLPPASEMKSALLSLSLHKETLFCAQDSLAHKRSLREKLEQRLTELSGISDLQGIVDGLKQLNLLVRSTREVKKKCITRTIPAKPVKRELEEEIRRRECSELERRFPIDILSHLEALVTSK